MLKNRHGHDDATTRDSGSDTRKPVRIPASGRARTAGRWLGPRHIWLDHDDGDEATAAPCTGTTSRTSRCTKQDQMILAATATRPVPLPGCLHCMSLLCARALHLLPRTLPLLRACECVCCARAFPSCARALHLLARALHLLARAFPAPARVLCLAFGRHAQLR